MARTDGPLSANGLFVKICGIARAEDANLAVALGASAIGFIFWPGSPRYLNPESARDITRGLPSNLTRVGVFVNEPVERVRETMDIAGVQVAQLHGNESAGYAKWLKRPFIKAVGLKDGEPVDLDAFAPEVVVLVDAHDPERHGGTGKSVDWNAARTIATSRQTILSGGLHAGNVARALATVRPYGVDVSSGVESAPGIKDPVRMKQFFEALR